MECVPQQADETVLAQRPAPMPAPVAAPAQAAPLASACWYDETAVPPAGHAVTWVDVRAAAAAKANPLNGVLRLSPAELAEKTFLRGERIVMVGTGFDDAALNRACQSLKRSGFAQIAVLRGGMRAWVRSGRFVAGERQPAWDEMPPGDYVAAVAAASTPEWPVFAVGLDAEQLVRLPVSPARQFADSQDGISLLADALAAAGNLPVLIIARDEAGIASLRRVLPPHETADVLWLAGGMAALGHFLQTQQAIAASAGRSLRPPCGAV